MAGSLVFGALATDIVDSGLVAGIIGNETQFTVMLWCNASTFTANRVIWSRGGGNARFIRVTAAGDIQAGATRAGGNTTYSTTSVPLALGVWTFVAVTFDLSAGAGLKIQFSSGLEGVPATACAFAVTTETGTTLTDDSTFHSFWGNNSPGLASPFQGSIAFPAWFPGILSLADQRLYQAAPRQVVSSNVAAEFKLFGIAAADAFDFSGNAAGTVTGATQGTGPSTSLVVSKYAANRALLTAMGLSDAQAFSVKDSRLCIKTDRTSWFDAMAPQGTTNARAQGVTATGVNVPTIASEGVVFDGVNDLLASAQDTRLVFDTASALHCLMVVKLSGNGPAVGAAADPTNASLFPHGYAQGAGGVIKGSFNPTGAGTGQIQPTSQLATGATVRAVLVGRYARDGGTSSGDDGWHFTVFGQQTQTISKNTPATTVAGGLKEFFGGFGGVFTSCTVYHQMWVAADMTPAAMAAYGAFAVSEFSAVLDASGAGSFLVSSHSWGVGTQTTDPLLPTIGSGTTAFAHLVATTATAKGTIQSKFGLIQNKQWISAVGGRTFDAARLQYAHESALILDGFRTGPKVAVVLFFTNDERTLALTLAQMKTAAAAYYTTLHNAGWTVLLCNAPPYGSGLGGAANGVYANASPDATIGAEGVIMQGMNTELGANLAPYGDRLITLTTTPGFRYTPRDTADTTNWNADETHPKDVGHVLLTSIILNAIVSSGTIWPATTLYRRRRR